MIVLVEEGNAVVAAFLEKFAESLELSEFHNAQLDHLPHKDVAIAQLLQLINAPIKETGIYQTKGERECLEYERESPPPTPQIISFRLSACTYVLVCTYLPRFNVQQAHHHWN